MKNNKQSIFHKSKETVTYAEEMRIILKGVNIIMGVTCLHQCWPSCLGMYCVDWGTQTDAIYVIQKEPQRASTPHACRWEKRKMTYSTKCISTASPSILNAQQLTLVTGEAPLSACTVFSSRFWCYETKHQVSGVGLPYKMIHIWFLELCSSLKHIKIWLEKKLSCNLNWPLVSQRAWHVAHDQMTLYRRYIFIYTFLAPCKQTLT